jgi:hypothetical protein
VLPLPLPRSGRDPMRLPVATAESTRLMSPNRGGRGRFRRRALRLETRRLTEELEQFTEELRLLSGSLERSAPISAKADHLRALDAQQRAHAALVEADGLPDVDAAREAITEGRRALEAVRSRLALRAGGTRPHVPHDPHD